MIFLSVSDDISFWDHSGHSPINFYIFVNYEGIKRGGVIFGLWRPTASCPLALGLWLSFWMFISPDSLYPGYIVNLDELGQQLLCSLFLVFYIFP